MKECSFCGMPLDSQNEGNLCDFCQNDDGIEMLAKVSDDSGVEDEYSGFIGSDIE
jgi:hypothetical protein